MRRPRHAVSGFVTAIVILFLFAPIVMVFANAFNKNENLAGWGGFTTKWFTEVFQDQRIRSDFWTSLTIALVTTGLSLVISVTAALWFRYASPRGRSLFELTNISRLLLPEVVVAVGLFVLFLQLGVPLGRGAIIVGHTVFLSAYATVILQARIVSMGTTLEAAASDLGATPWRAFRRVTLPQLAPAVAVGGLLVFTFSFDDVIASQFLSGGSVETLPVLLLGLIRHQVTPAVNAVGCILVLITLATFALGVASAGLRSIGGLTPSRVKE